MIYPGFAFKKSDRQSGCDAGPVRYTKHAGVLESEGGRVTGKTSHPVPLYPWWDIHPF